MSLVSPRSDGSRTRLAGLGIAALAVTSWYLLDPGETAAQRPAGRPLPDATTGLWISASTMEDGRRLLLVVDPQTRTVAVYHVDAQTGGLALRSTRDITWDLMVGDFNAQAPKPDELRKMLDVGRPQPPGITPAASGR